jgi:hypothetical protein
MKNLDIVKTADAGYVMETLLSCSFLFPADFLRLATIA